MLQNKPFALMLVLILAFVALAPSFLGIVSTNMIAELAIMAMFAVSVNMLLSFTGLLTFGHALFFGVGAYATALAIIHIEGITLFPALLIGVSSSMVAALICSPLLVRVSGTAFAMLTLAFGQLMYVLCLKFRDITGGEDGITLFDMPSLSFFGIVSLDVSSPMAFYYFAVIICVASMWAMWYFTRTPLGGVQVGIRDNALRIDYLGYHVPTTKAIVFIISGGFAGLAGALFAIFQQVVSVDGVLHIMVSFIPIMAIMLGGIGSFMGPITGSGLLLLLDELSKHYTDRVELVSGIVFILAVMYAPFGLNGLYLKAQVFWQLRKRKKLEMESAS